MPTVSMWQQYRNFKFGPCLSSHLTPHAGCIEGDHEVWGALQGRARAHNPTHGAESHSSKLHKCIIFCPHATPRPARFTPRDPNIAAASPATTTPPVRGQTCPWARHPSPISEHSCPAYPAIYTRRNRGCRHTSNAVIDFSFHSFATRRLHCDLKRVPSVLNS